MARAWFMGMRGQMKRGDPKAAPCEENDDRCGDLIRPHYLPVTRNSGCSMATFFGALLNAGYSGVSTHSRVNSPFSIRLTVASQKPSNSRLSFQKGASTLAPTRNASQGLGALTRSDLSVANGAGMGQVLGLF